MALVMLCFLAVICSLLQQALLLQLLRGPFCTNVLGILSLGLVSLALVVFVLVAEGLSRWRPVDRLAITCYQCNSHNDSRCLLQKLPDELRLPCGPKDTMCRKISQVVEFEMNGMPPDNRVIRGCGWDESSYKGRCYQRSGFGGRQEVCSCLEDGCNSASLPVGATALMLLTFALLRF